MTLSSLLSRCLLLALFIESGLAESQFKARIEQYGIYTVVETGKDLTNVQPPVHISKTIKFLKETDTIVPRKGLSFGYSYIITNLPIDQPLELQIETVRPEIVLPSGQRSSGRVLDVICNPMGGVWTNHVGYRFDEEYEMVAGAWTFNVYHDKKKILTKTFYVRNKC